MRIAIIAMGTRGDVQPYIALGKGLSAVGHDIRLVSHEDFRALTQSHGLAFWPMRGNVQGIMERPEIRALLEKGSFIAITRQTAKEALPAALEWSQDGLAACAGVDVLIAGIGGLFVALALAEKFDVPLAQAYLVPFTPTRAFPRVLLPAATARLGGGFNYISHHLTRQIMWQGSRSADLLARQQVLGLPPAPFWGPYGAERMNHLPVLYGFSPTVIPPPADWDQRMRITGYWFLDEEASRTPPPALVDFLQAEPRPIYISALAAWVCVNRKRPPISYSERWREPGSRPSWRPAGAD